MAKLRKSDRETPVGGIVGPIRHTRPGDDARDLRPGDVVLLDQPDLDARRADDLIGAQVAAVLNASSSVSGRVPNQGPSLLAKAGIPLVDLSSSGSWSQLKNGDVVQVLDGRVLRDGTLIGTGAPLDEDRARTDLQSAERGLATRLDSLTANATDHIHREQAMLLDGAHVPRLRTRVARRPSVVVSHAYDAKSDLTSLKRFIAQHDPVLIGAGAGAELLLDAGYTPDLLVGALDNLSDRAIRSSGEVVVATATGRVDRPERLERHGKDVVTFTSTGSDDDLAILLADTNEASVVVHVGAPPTLHDLLEQAPSDVARMFVARLRAGAKIVDAKSVKQLSTQPMARWPFVLMVLVGLLAVGLAIAVTPGGRDGLDALVDSLRGAFTSLEGILR